MYTLVDAAGLLLATLLGGVAIALPGVALARLFRFPPRDALVVGLAVLPLLDSLLGRLVGLDAALAATLALAAAGAALLVASRAERRISAIALALCALWLTLVLVEWVDLDIGGRLYQPFTVIDTVKHAATAQAIVDTGVPPADPFFLRAQHVSYYYFFYLLPALVERLGFGLVDARAAVGGCVVWVGLGLYGLVRLALERAGVARSRPSPLLVVAVLAAAGLDIIPALRMGLLQGTWLASPVIWNEQVDGWLESLLWVPHHVTGCIAGMLGLMTVARLARPEDRPADDHAPRSAALAAICFAAALGLSVWLTLVLVVTVAAWGVTLAAARRWRALAWLAAAGLGALVLALPQIHDLIVGRTGGGAAIVATVRAFPPVDGLVAAGPWRYVARLAALPFSYFAAFGALASGALLFWRADADRLRMTEFARILVLAAVAGLALGAFFKSTLFNNDLGWRVVEFPLLAGVVWTIAALETHWKTAAPGPVWRRTPGFLMALLVLGWATNLYVLAGMRAYPFFATQQNVAFMWRDPATEHELRKAYAWADRNLPAAAVLQHDPLRPRAFAFALYGRHRTAVSDGYSSLFGADPAAVDRRIAALAPVFAGDLPPAQVRARATAEGIDDLVVTAEDPAFARRDGFVWRATPAYASSRVRIIPVAALAGLGYGTGPKTTAQNGAATTPATEAE